MLYWTEDMLKNLFSVWNNATERNGNTGTQQQATNRLISQTIRVHGDNDCIHQEVVEFAGNNSMGSED